MQPTDENGQPVGEPEIIEDLPASERFFAGGDTTIRGFALDTVGTPKTISERGFPRGGNGVLILNAEPTEMDSIADVVLRGSISEILPRLTKA